MSDRQYHPQVGPAECRRDRLRRGKVSRVLRQWIFARDGGRCVDCGSSDRLTADHLVPAVMGGREWASNLITRCQSCNSRRHGQFVREHGYQFYPSEYALREAGL